MKELRHIGGYGIILKNDSIILVKKVGGPYDGKLDLPGGTIEFGEKPESTLVRELKEEIGINVIKYDLLDANSVNIQWTHKNELQKIHHIGIFYTIQEYTGKIEKEVVLDAHNDDSLGGDFYSISSLKKSMLSDIAILVLEQLGYNLLP